MSITIIYIHKPDVIVYSTTKLWQQKEKSKLQTRLKKKHLFFCPFSIWGEKSVRVQSVRVQCSVRVISTSALYDCRAEIITKISPFTYQLTDA